MEIGQAIRRVGEKPPAMRGLVVGAPALLLPCGAGKRTSWPPCEGRYVDWPGPAQSSSTTISVGPPGALIAQPGPSRS